MAIFGNKISEPYVVINSYLGALRTALTKTSGSFYFVKETNVDYEDVTDKNKIKEMFNYGKE